MILFGGGPTYFSYSKASCYMHRVVSKRKKNSDISLGHERFITRLAIKCKRYLCFLANLTAQVLLSLLSFLVHFVHVTSAGFPRNSIEALELTAGILREHLGAGISPFIIIEQR